MTLASECPYNALVMRDCPLLDPTSMSQSMVAAFQRSIRWIVVAVSLTLLTGASVSFAQSGQTVSPIGEEVAAGPWRMTVLEVLTGDDAAAATVSASDANPSAGDGLQYISARVQVTNGSSEPHQIGQEDFAVVDANGVLRRSAGVFAPSPELGGMVQPGEALEGWVLSSAAADASNLVLLYDSTTITGEWADHAFAIADGATFDPSQVRATELDRDGRDPEAPVGIGRVIATREWTVQIAEVVTGAAVNDISPEETQRLGQSYYSGGGQYISCLDTWVAVRIEVANNGGDGITRFLSPTAFQLADSDGSALLDIRMLTPPSPDVSGEYAAGATRSGWISFELPSNCGPDGANLLYDANVLRFQPFATSEDVRYLTWSDTGESGPEPTATAKSFDPDQAIAEGATAVTTDDGVRMRDQPSVDGEIVAELDAGVEVEITGPPEEGGGYTWYPVRIPETDDEGWIVQDFLAEP